jgi:hypothetical protein
VAFGTDLCNTGGRYLSVAENLNSSLYNLHGMSERHEGIQEIVVKCISSITSCHHSVQNELITMNVWNNGDH